MNVFPVMVRGMPRPILICLALALLPMAGAFVASASAEEELAGPVEASVTRVLDGDTLEVRAQVWLGLELTSLVRIRGIDAPELHSNCLAEREMAAEARDRLTELAGEHIRLLTSPPTNTAGVLTPTSPMRRAPTSARR